MKYLLIAGHGKKRNGTFDPGATGFIKQGEHRYMRDVLFPAMKKYADNNFIFHTAYNVYDYGNLVALARKYGKDTAVIECHFDAVSNSSASGGHVIVYKGFKPDTMDLRIRDVIKKHIGLAYPTHHGEKGISGRSDLANVNRAANGGVNYRLIELGFGTNKKDAEIMLKNADAIAKDLVEAIQGKTAKTTQTSKPKSTQKTTSSDKLYRVRKSWADSKSQLGAFSVLDNAKRLVDKNTGYKVYDSTGKQVYPTAATSSKKSISQIAQEVIDKKWGNGSERKQKLEAAGYNYTTVQNKVNSLLGVSGGGKRVPPQKSASQLAKEVIAGQWGNGDERKRRLTDAGYDYNAIQNAVNALLTPASKSIDQLAREVINGDWGNNPERQQRLIAAGYDYNAIQKRVNELSR